MNSESPPFTLRETLLASAKRLRLGVEGPLNAEALEVFAAALGAPNGYIVKVGGGALRHDLCSSTAEGAMDAARASGLRDDTYTVEPFLVLSQ
ncbi:hypothetical protein N7359_01805 [Stenotrophomonas maltophilia]|uniref:hypothetical protein n=1 Tax=Stenotrophomonas maltophilia TaxID=40324 RepID=UPI00244D0C30|nr:hypothetical protein [Stenotrophomonas maltophilia]MDH0071276.1 hypothetical protein [Stenotrophomonas maltophilia]MDH0104127.1 hypothetical protein [Stenotrophomonas maltophilia]MDH0330224.1 hypothetical protein [Stenotrophomonas maltophilia]